MDFRRIKEIKGLPRRAAALVLAAAMIASLSILPTKAEEQECQCAQPCTVEKVDGSCAVCSESYELCTAGRQKAEGLKAQAELEPMPDAGAEAAVEEEPEELCLLTGTVYLDEDEDGKVGPKETVLKKVSVSAVDPATGKEAASAVTDKKGHYELSVGMGAYELRFQSGDEKKPLTQYVVLQERTEKEQKVLSQWDDKAKTLRLTPFFKADKKGVLSAGADLNEESAVLDLALRLCEVSGTVTLENGKAVKGVTVRLIDTKTDKEAASAVTNKKGVYTCFAPVGSYRVELESKKKEHTVLKTKKKTSQWDDKAKKMLLFPAFSQKDGKMQASVKLAERSSVLNAVLRTMEEAPAAEAEAEAPAENSTEAESAPDGAKAETPEKAPASDAADFGLGADVESSVTYGTDKKLLKGLRAMGGEDNAAWYWDVYYVNEDDRYHVEETNDFNVKYQVNFHNSQDLEAYSVEIRVPKALADENGQNIARFPEDNVTEPSQHSLVPRDKVSEAGPDMTPFCWYIDGDDVVFTNFRELTSGTNAAFQVMYGPVSIMNMTDESTWSITPTISVQRLNEATPDTDTATPLTGHIDTAIKLSNVTKRPLTLNAKNYGPGLYSEAQVDRFAGRNWDKVLQAQDGNADKSKEKLLSEYYFVVWRVTATVSATQMYNLNLTEHADHEYDSGMMDGIVLGMTDRSSGTDLDNTTLEMVSKGLKPSQDYSYDVVTAYKKSELDDAGWNNIVYNSVDIEAIPYDGKDENQSRSANAEWAFADYSWTVRGEGDISKDNDKTYYGWTNIYDQKNSGSAVEDYGSLRFSTAAELKGYAATHIVPETGSEGLGEYIPGTYYTMETVDNTLYADPHNIFLDYGEFMKPDGSGDKTDQWVELTKDDYYFTGVSITQIDKGYDPWEDEYNKDMLESDKPGVDYKTYVYAKFAKPASGDVTDADGWTLVQELDWDSERMYYSFSREELAKEPYKVKAVHSTTNYETTCNIYVTTTIRGDSPVFHGPNGFATGAIADDKYITVRDESTVNVTRYDGTTPHSLMKGVDYGDAWLYPVLKQSATFKTQSQTNDPMTQSVKVRYNLTEYDGYFVENNNAMKYYKTMGLESPGKNKVVFYDLLPYGVSFDPAQEVIAGRLTDLNKSTFTVQPKAWNQSNVTVKAEVVDKNYNGKGQELVQFVLTYDAGDPSGLLSGTLSSSKGKESLWAEGWGVSFGAYYGWDKADELKNAVNYSAFLVGETDEGVRPIIGLDQSGPEKGTIYPDDGGDNGLVQENPFLPNIDGNDKTNEVMYAVSSGSDSLVVASSSNITKLVKADADRFAPFGKEAVVIPGDTYTYEITVHNSGSILGDIAIFDNMEYAAYMRRLPNAESTESANESYYQYENTFWYGTFENLITTELDSDPNCAGYRVYYHSDRAAKKPANGEAVDDMDAYLLDKGWQLAADFAKQADWKSKVKAIAIVLPDTFYLNNMGAVSFRIQMRSPAQDTSDPDNLPSSSVGSVTVDGNNKVTEHLEYDSGKTAEYAYNNTAFYSVDYKTQKLEDINKDDPDNLHQCVTSNSVRVSEEHGAVFELVKEFDSRQVAEGLIPESALDEEFVFSMELVTTDPTNHTAPDRDHHVAYTHKEYTLWEKDDHGNWVQIETQQPHSTDTGGRLTLKADQKAVFRVPGDYVYRNNENTLSSKLLISEAASLFWESHQYLTENALTVTNTYKGVIYATKNVVGLPGSFTEAQKKGFAFRFCLLDENGAPVSHAPYWLVDEVRLDGSSPNKLGEGVTDDNGEFTIHYGDVVAIMTEGALGTEYTIRELPLDPDGDWEAVWDEENVYTDVGGTVAEISNIYRWRDLLLAKTLKQADHVTYPVSFQFRLERWNDGTKTYEPETGELEWVLTNSAGNQDVPDSGGKLNARGEFTVTVDSPDTYIRIKKLEQNTRYRISELTTAEGECLGATDFRPQTAEQVVTMPVYADSRRASIVNDYLPRAVSVKKIVAGTSAEGKTFTMKIETRQAGSGNNFVAYARKDYEVYDGKGNLVGSGKTLADGTFTIQDGQTVTFPDVGRSGEYEYRITETDAGGLTQLAPVKDRAAVPAEGVLGKEDSLETFVNGGSGTLLIGKEYVGVDEESQKFVDQLMDKNFWDSLPYQMQERFKVTIGIEVIGSAASSWWPSSREETRKINLLTGENTILWWYGDKTQELYPWERVVITSNDLFYSNMVLKEVNGAWMQHYNSEGVLLTSTEKTPSVSVDYKETGMKLLVNELRVNEYQSVIRKLIKFSSDPAPVAQGAELLLRVERWDGTRWSPAEGVDYFVKNEREVINPARFEEQSQLAVGTDGNPIGNQTTGSDGLITLTKGEDPELWPSIYFSDVVSIQPAEPCAVGTLRVVELPERSDPTWGRLGLMEESDSVEIYNNKPVGKFINVNKTKPFELTKAVQGTEDRTQRFTFVLSQVLRNQGEVTTADPEDPDQSIKPSDDFAIKESIPGKNVSYDVYENGQYVSTQNTGSSGEVILKGGQTAKFNLPEGTLWTVEEVQNTPYKLQGMGRYVNACKLEDNKVLVYAVAGAAVKLPTALVVDWADPVIQILNKSPRNAAEQWWDNRSWAHQTIGLYPGEKPKPGEFLVNVEYADGSTDIAALTASQYTIDYDSETRMITFKTKADATDSEGNSLAGLSPVTVGPMPELPKMRVNYLYLTSWGTQADFMPAWYVEQYSKLLKAMDPLNGWFSYFNSTYHMYQAVGDKSAVSLVSPVIYNGYSGTWCYSDTSKFVTGVEKFNKNLTAVIVPPHATSIKLIATTPTNPVAMYIPPENNLDMTAEKVFDTTAVGTKKYIRYLYVSEEFFRTYVSDKEEDVAAFRAFNDPGLDYQTADADANGNKGYEINKLSAEDSFFGLYGATQKKVLATLKPIAPTDKASGYIYIRPYVAENYGTPAN